MRKAQLSFTDFCRAAKKLGCDVATIRAVAQVESRGEGFYEDGFPVILFERHKFHAFTHGKYDASHPHISNKKAGGYGPAGPNQRRKFSEAFSLAPEAAMMSCSWGKFQIMGFNWDDLGYDSIHEFVDRMKMSEAEHLEAFVRFVITNGLKDELQRLDFTTFARIYNGKDFKKNAYDSKMSSFYKRYKAENVRCDSLIQKTSSVSILQSEDTFPDATIPAFTDEDEFHEDIPQSNQDEAKADLANALQGSPVEGATEVSQTEVTKTEGGGTVAQTVQQKNEQDVNIPANVKGPREYNEIGFIPTIRKDLAAVGVGNLGFEGITSYFQNASGYPEWLVSLLIKASIIIGILSAAYLLFRGGHYIMFRISEYKRLHTETLVATDTTKKDINYV